MGYHSKFKENTRKAIELSDRLSDRERYRIQGSYYWTSESTYDKAIEAFDKCFQLYPDDVPLAINLGCVYRDIEQWDKALELFELNITNKVESVFPYTNAARIYMANGLYEKAEEILQEYLRIHGETALIHRQLAYTYLCQGKYDLALNEADKGFSLAPTDYENLILKGDIHLIYGDFIEAEKIYERLFNASEQIAHSYGRERLGILYLSQGKYAKSVEQAKLGMGLAEEIDDKGFKSDFLLISGYANLKSGNPGAALKELNEAKNIAIQAGSYTRQIRTLYLRGLTLLDMKSTDEARRTSDDLKDLIDQWLNAKLIRYYYHLMGMIEQKKENYAKAIENFEKAISFLDYQRSPDFYYDIQALFFESLALAYFKSGNMGKAQEQYERITRLTTGRLYHGNTYAKSYYMIGKICEQRENRSEAIANYEKFLDLWKDADPGQPEVEDAKKRLAALQG